MAEEGHRELVTPLAGDHRVGYGGLLERTECGATRNRDDHRKEASIASQGSRGINHVAGGGTCGQVTRMRWRSPLRRRNSFSDWKTRRWGLNWNCRTGFCGSRVVLKRSGVGS